MTPRDTRGYVLIVAGVAFLVAAMLCAVLYDHDPTGCRPDESVRCYR